MPEITRDHPRSPERTCVGGRSREARRCDGGRRRLALVCPHRRRRAAASCSRCLPQCPMPPNVSQCQMPPSAQWLPILMATNHLRLPSGGQAPPPPTHTHTQARSTLGARGSAAASGTGTSPSSCCRNAWTPSRPSRRPSTRSISPPARRGWLSSRRRPSRRGPPAQQQGKRHRLLRAGSRSSSEGERQRSLQWVAGIKKTRVGPLKGPAPSGVEWLALAWR